MLTFIRRLINSKVGLFVTFAFLALIGFAFAAGDITGMSPGGAVPTGDTVATVGDRKISEAELRSQVQNEMEGYRQEQPGLDMAQFIAGGGFDATLSRMINGIALEEFGRDQGMIVSKLAVDGQIASIPSLQGVDGKFSQQAYQQLLQQRKLSDVQVRGDIARETMAQHLTLPTVGASQIPASLALPYASLLLEKRAGAVGYIPTRAMGEGTPPTDAEVATFYQRNIARYTIGERRVIRYAVVTADQLQGSTVPSEAEVAAAYQQRRQSYAPTEKRTLVQVILPSQAAADALVTKVKGGTSIQDAARAVGLEAVTLPALEKANYASQTSTAIADAAFGAAQGTLIGPLRSPLGFTVARVDKVEQIAGKSLDQARPELVVALTKDKTAQALSDIHDKADDAISAKSTFDEIVGDQKLRVNTTPALLADGRDPDNAAIKAAPDFMPVIAAAFAAEQGDSPQIVPMDQAGGFAVVTLDRIVASAAPPVAKIRAVVARDFALDRARRAARKIAADISARVSKGTPLAQAIAASGLKAPPVQPLNASRAQLASSGRNVPPPLALMFSMSEKTAKLIEAPNDEGWFVVYLDKIERGNAAGQPAVIAATRGDLGKVIGREYVEQFTEAVRRQVGVKRNEKAIAEVKAALLGQGAAN